MSATARRRAHSSRLPAGGAPAPAMRRVHVRIGGVVQGVGFRPHVHRLARELALAGWVRNDERGVLLEIEGPPDALDAFLARVIASAPRLAVVEEMRTRELQPSGACGFAILASDRAGTAAALVSPDVAVCADCLAELLDPADRRYRHPFATCTNCGPRYTIVQGVPYDRARTTMAGFPLCAECRAEYEDPADRRFHAEPIACPACGPHVRLLGADGQPAAGWPGEDAVAGAAAALRAGQIVAVKGLGGYHLACRADDEHAVAALRARKHREDKPFALMAPDLATARALVTLTAADEALLAGPLAPILLAPRRTGAGQQELPGSARRSASAAPRVAPSVAPRSGDLGVMLPATPLHHLLLRDAACGALVMTSGNRSDEPIAHDDAAARERLAGIADLFLVHDRPIHVRVDDSVLRSVRGRRPVWLRRSRGEVPGAIALPLPAPRPLLACGAELKSTCCVAKGPRAWVGHHIGDLQSWETLLAYRQSVAHLERLFDVAPQLVVHDLHPDYRSTAEALAREGVEHVAIQHHHAHLAATLAEHGETGPAVGAIFDGAGLGLDGAVWGGELLVGDVRGFERAGHVRPVALPGGDRAAREPWRMACAWLCATGDDAASERQRARLAHATSGAPHVGVLARTWDAVDALARSPLAPQTTSIGRLFDAVVALAGLRTTTTYEGQAAAELEAAAAACSERGAYPLPLVDRPDGLQLDACPTVLAAARDAERGVDAPRIATRFHRALARATADACVQLAERRGLATVALGGGVWVNRLLLELTATALEARGLRVLVPERLPPGDGGLSYGQAAIAAANDRSER
ncbi:MAG TPA: carbamoyltransferase HypF [Conexibacter sp.]|jgi:hydrogenase maturation protein HypF|nr:carbamoyltransferase HypF [Conexibacter sp.]